MALKIAQGVGDTLHLFWCPVPKAIRKPDSPLIPIGKIEFERLPKGRGGVQLMLKIDAFEDLIFLRKEAVDDPDSVLPYFDPNDLEPDENLTSTVFESLMEDLSFVNRKLAGMVPTVEIALPAAVYPFDISQRGKGKEQQAKEFLQESVRERESSIRMPSAEGERRELEALSPPIPATRVIKRSHGVCPKCQGSKARYYADYETPKQRTITPAFCPSCGDEPPAESTPHSQRKIEPGKLRRRFPVVEEHTDPDAIGGSSYGGMFYPGE